jgi:hypothetical protein
MLEELKKKYGVVYTLNVKLDDESNDMVTLYLRKPDRTTRSLIGKLVQQDGLKAVEGALKNLHIGEDSDLKKVIESDYALSACEASIVEMLTVQSATLKKN